MKKLARLMALLAALLLALPTAADEAKKLYKQGKEAEIRLLLAKKVSNKASIAKIMEVSRTALHHFIKTRQLAL